MQQIRQWITGAFVACALASGVSSCGGNSSSKGDDDSDAAADGSGGTNSGSTGSGDTGSTGSGDTGSSGGTGSGDNNASTGNGNGTSGLVMGDPVSMGEYAARAAGIVCEWVAPCCGEIGLSVDEDNCAAVLAAQFSADQASADPDNYTYDPDLAGDCLATARDLYSRVGCDLGAPSEEVGAEADEACSNVFAGKLAPGSPCTSDIECAKGPGDEVDCTSLTSDETATVCVVEHRAAEGEPCYWTCTEEGSAYFCTGTSAETPADQGRCFTNDQLSCVDGVCARQPGVGEPCVANGTCAEGSCLNGVCVAGGDGACSTDAECSDSLYCDGSQCVPKKQDGDGCDFSTECQSGSCSDSVCDEGSDGGLAITLLCAIAGGGL